MVFLPIVPFGINRPERERSAGQVDVQSLPFIFVESGGLDQQATNCCATN